MFSRLLGGSLTSSLLVWAGLLAGWDGGPEVGGRGGWGPPTGGTPSQPAAAWSWPSLPQARFLALAVGLAVEDQFVGGVGQPVDDTLCAERV